MTEEYSWCDCYGPGKNEDLSPPCGCGDPECTCRTYRDEDVMHWRGGHWHTGCAFVAVLKEKEAAVLAEKERCAKVAEACAKRNEDCPPTCKCGDGWHIAICIRGRGKADGPR